MFLETPLLRRKSSKSSRSTKSKKDKSTPAASAAAASSTIEEDETKVTANDTTIILDTEKEVMMLNIDYFEQWDRIYNVYKQSEQHVLKSMKVHGIKVI